MFVVWYLSAYYSTQVFSRAIVFNVEPYKPDLPSVTGDNVFGWCHIVWLHAEESDVVVCTLLPKCMYIKKTQRSSLTLVFSVLDVETQLVAECKNTISLICFVRCLSRKILNQRQLSFSRNVHQVTVPSVCYSTSTGLNLVDRSPLLWYMLSSLQYRNTIV